MRLQYSLLELCLCLLQLNAHPTVEARHAIVPRDDATMPAQGPASVTATYRSFSDSTTQDVFPSDGSASSNYPVDTSVSTSSPLPNNNSSAPDTASQPTSKDLPIVPVITPALSVAGVVLMLTGPFYALVGIKNKWLHVFLSAAYLTSLAVTVLIVYVMHPPVSNAVQGAYFVAACVTGLIFGGGSVIFADITEALGCLLGGFCLAMWFLVLVPGGLIRSTAGKPIFIACLTVGSFGLYISHWTRAYGLIGATAFAGATVIVLGIDCFSRAGLKEFWLYIWGKYKMKRPRKNLARSSYCLFVAGAHI